MTDHFSQNKNRPGPVGKSVSELVAKILEPSIARKTGMRTDLIAAWTELAGPDYAPVTRPEKIDWPRRANEDDPFKPAVLVVACDPACALFFEHDRAQVLERVNRYFGFHAIERIRIVQKPVRKNGVQKTAKKKEIAPEQRSKLNGKLSDVKGEGLKQSLKRLGEGIIRRSKS